MNELLPKAARRIFFLIYKTAPPHGQKLVRRSRRTTEATFRLLMPQDEMQTQLARPPIVAPHGLCAWGEKSFRDPLQIKSKGNGLCTISRPWSPPKKPHSHHKKMFVQNHRFMYPLFAEHRLRRPPICMYCHPITPQQRMRPPPRSKKGGSLLFFVASMLHSFSS